MFRLYLLIIPLSLQVSYANAILMTSTHPYGRVELHSEIRYGFCNPGHFFRFVMLTHTIHFVEIQPKTLC